MKDIVLPKLRELRQQDVFKTMADPVEALTVLSVFHYYTTLRLGIKIILPKFYLNSRPMVIY